MQIQKVPISRIKPAAYNPRVDLAPGDPEYEKLKKSIMKFGLVDPLVWNKRSGNLIGGHQRLKILVNDLKAKSVEVVVVDLKADDERALNIALNRVEGDWDEQKLSSLLIELSRANYDLSLTGFDDVEIDKFLQVESTEDDRDANDVPEARRTSKIKTGQIWMLGKHRLMCGDSTIPGNTKLLSGSIQPVCMWTDPPYGVDYTGKTKEALKIANDGKEGLGGLLARAFKCADSALAAGAAIYIAHPAGALSVVFGNVFLATGWRLHETLVWVKDSMVLGHSDYHYRHEPILFGYKSGEGRAGRGCAGWYGPNNATSVFEIARPKASEDHPTMKPVELIEAMIKNSAPRDGVVLDPFLGSGSTLLACERSGRVCYGMELDPSYCDVVIRRWEEFTGKQAELVDKVLA